jgi:hypothetical protein
MRSAFILGSLVLAACGSRTAPSEATEPLPGPACTWTFVGAPVRVSPPDDRAFIESPVAAIPVEGGVLLAWTSVRDGLPRVTVRRVSWDLASNGEAHVVLEPYHLDAETVTLASGFGHTAIAVSTSGAVLQPLSTEGAPIGSAAKLGFSSSFALRATPTGFDLLGDGPHDSMRTRWDRVRLDASGTELDRSTLFEPSGFETYLEGPGRATFTDGSFLAVARRGGDSGVRLFAGRFAADGSPLGTVRAVPSGMIWEEPSAHTPVVDVRGGALVAALEWTKDNRSQLTIRPLTIDGVSRGDAITIAPQTIAFDLTADRGRALVAWAASWKDRPVIRLQTLRPSGAPFGDTVDFDAVQLERPLRLVVENDRGLLFASRDAPSGGPYHVVAIPLACSR